MKTSTVLNHFNLNYAKKHEKRKPKSTSEFIQVLMLLKPQINEKVLDIGCNTGEFCYFLKKNFGVEANGIDLNEKAIEIAKRKYPNIEFEVKNVNEIYETEKFDAITMIEVIEHLSEPEWALRRVKSALKSNGRLVITTPNRWGYATRLFLKLKREKYSDSTHIKIYDPFSLSALIKETGYSVKKIFTYFDFRIGIPFPIFGGTIFVLCRKVD